MKVIVKLIKEDLIISDNIDLKSMKLRDIDWYRIDLIENIDLMSFKLDDIQIFIYLYKKIWIILKEHKFAWYEYTFNIFLKKFDII